MFAKYTWRSRIVFFFQGDSIWRQKVVGGNCTLSICLNFSMHLIFSKMSAVAMLFCSHIVQDRPQWRFVEWIGCNTASVCTEKLQSLLYTCNGHSYLLVSFQQYLLSSKERSQHDFLTLSGPLSCSIEQLIQQQTSVQNRSPGFSRMIQCLLRFLQTLLNESSKSNFDRSLQRNFP